MSDRVRTALSGYAKYRGRAHFAFIMHRVAGLATIVFLTLHILTTATVFFAPSLYDVLAQTFRNPLVMFAEIILSFFVVYHGVNGLRIAYIDLFRPDLWARKPSGKLMSTVFILTVLLWLPVLVIMGHDLLKYGFGLFGG